MAGAANLSMDEAELEKQYQQYKSEFDRWREENKNHPDKNAFQQYEQQWKDWECQVEARRRLIKQNKTAALSDTWGSTWGSGAAPPPMPPCYPMTPPMMGMGGMMPPPPPMMYPPMMPMWPMYPPMYPTPDYSSYYGSNQTVPKTTPNTTPVPKPPATTQTPQTATQISAAPVTYPTAKPQQQPRPSEPYGYPSNQWGYYPPWPPVSTGPCRPPVGNGNPAGWNDHNTYGHQGQYDYSRQQQNYNGYPHNVAPEPVPPPGVRRRKPGLLGDRPAVKPGCEHETHTYPQTWERPMEEPEAQQLPTVETVSNCQSVTDSSEDLPHKPPHRSNDLENSNVEEISGKTEDDLINGEPNGKISEETTDATVIEPQPITSNNGTLVEQIESNGAVEGILQVERAEVQPV